VRDSWIESAVPALADRISWAYGWIDMDNSSKPLVVKGDKELENEIITSLKLLEKQVMTEMRDIHELLYDKEASIRGLIQGRIMDLEIEIEKRLKEAQKCRSLKIMTQQAIDKGEAILRKENSNA